MGAIALTIDHAKIAFPTAPLIAPCHAGNPSEQVVRAANMLSDQKRPLPDHMYVDIATITKTASALIFLLCLFSLAIGFLTKFYVIQPFVSTVIAFSSIVFFAMGVFLGAVAELVGIEGGVVSGVINLESSGVEASDWRPRHDEPYHEA